VYPEDRLPPNLRNFYNDLKAGKWKIWLCPNGWAR
jgi:hypothetical protein